MTPDTFHKKTIEEILADFEKECRGKNVEELQNLLFRLQSIPLMMDEGRKIKIAEKTVDEVSVKMGL